MCVKVKAATSKGDALTFLSLHARTKVIKSIYNKENWENWIVSAPYAPKPMSNVDVNRIFTCTEGAGCIEK